MLSRRGVNGIARKIDYQLIGSKSVDEKYPHPLSVVSLLRQTQVLVVAVLQLLQKITHVVL